ncbi:MAG: hypothetical protein RL708_2701 [Bacteroidota bacterium]|jgi:3-deoxy-D-manno-octulosonic-acid transferase
MFLYNISIRVYYILVFVFSFFNKKAKLFYNGRKNWQQLYAEKLKTIKNPVWVHCSSLGEFEQGRPLIEWIKKEYPNKQIVVTFFSPSGFEIQKQYKSADAVLYLPLDTPKNAVDFIHLLQPSIAIFVKYEFWLNYLFQLQIQHIPTVIISAKFRANQIFFKWYGKHFKKALQCFTTIFVQDEYSKSMLQTIGIHQVEVANDTRFDRVYQNSLQVQLPNCIHQFCDNKKIIVLGSVWQPDEEIFIRWYKTNLPKNWKIIWVPHEIETSKINQLKSKIAAPTLLYSEINNQPIEGSPHQHLIINTIGMLSKIYSVASIAYIGGGFGSSIHNILEPAVFGMPVIFGPKYHKFNEAFDLINEGSAFAIQNEQQLTVILNKLIKNESELTRLSSISNKYVVNNLGGTKTITDYLVSKKII